jgi:hypothetical protein
MTHKTKKEPMNEDGKVAIFLIGVYFIITPVVFLIASMTGG